MGCHVQDLETEIFLHILHQHSGAITGLVEEQASMRGTIADGDGMAFVRCFIAAFPCTHFTDRHSAVSDMG